jgi:3',5'-cyclic AMP phosphodiesterase CpdA
MSHWNFRQPARELDHTSRLPLIIQTLLVLTTLLFDSVPNSDARSYVPLAHHRAHSSTFAAEVRPSTPLPMEKEERLISDFNIAIAGDWGCSENSSATAENINNKEPELVLVPGDLSYNSNDPSCWYEIISAFESKTKISIGNHDDGEKIKSEYLKHFNLTRSFYSFYHENIHIVVMDPYILYGTGSPQYNFVEEDLRAASSNKSIDWIFVMVHEPLYTSLAVHHSSGSLREAYHPLFDKYGVDLVIQAHNHIYSRTFPLQYNSDTPREPIIVNNSSENTISNNNSSNQYTDPSIPIFIVAGTAGRELHDIEEQRPYVAYNSDSVYGFLNIDVINNGKTLIGTFHANSNSSSIKDQFIINKP